MFGKHVRISNWNSGKYFTGDISLAAEEKLKTVDEQIQKLKEEICTIDQLDKKHKEIKSREMMISVTKLQ